MDSGDFIRKLETILYQIPAEHICSYRVEARIAKGKGRTAKSRGEVQRAFSERQVFDSVSNVFRLVSLRYQLQIVHTLSDGYIRLMSVHNARKRLPHLLEFTREPSEIAVLSEQRSPE